MCIPVATHVKRQQALALTYQATQKDGQSLSKFGPHDLRRTASTLLHEEGYNTDWIAKCLAHEQKGVRAGGLKN